MIGQIFIVSSASDSMKKDWKTCNMPEQIYKPSLRLIGSKLVRLTKEKNFNLVFSLQVRLEANQNEVEHLK
jgi:hypothetical protein